MSSSDSNDSGSTIEIGRGNGGGGSSSSGGSSGGSSSGGGSSTSSESGSGSGSGSGSTHVWETIETTTEVIETYTETEWGGKGVQGTGVNMSKKV
ncbi:hypothetical protein GE21DRAFT_1334669 [Neurospora crassa]|nr:hypothetical protein GE21DRAFT_1334669 [Neurospora crassa]